MSTLFHALRRIIGIKTHPSAFPQTHVIVADDTYLLIVREYDVIVPQAPLL